MRFLWNLIAFLAVVHLLAVGMFVGWLWQSKRLNLGRLDELKLVLAVPIPEAERAAAEKQAAEETARAQALAEARDKLPPATSATQIALTTKVQERESQAARRLSDEQHQLLAQLDLRQTELDQKLQQLESDKAAWKAAVGAEQKRKTDEQFLKTVKQYESVPPKQGKQMLQQLVTEGELPQAVAYLDAMDSRAAKKILTEFKTPEEIKLATELLERLRKFGTPAELAKDTVHADASGSAP